MLCTLVDLLEAYYWSPHFLPFSSTWCETNEASENRNQTEKKRKPVASTTLSLFVYFKFWNQNFIFTLCRVLMVELKIWNKQFPGQIWVQLLKLHKMRKSKSSRTTMLLFSSFLSFLKTTNQFWILPTFIIKFKYFVTSGNVGLIGIKFLFLFQWSILNI